MSRPRWPDAMNSASEFPGTVHPVGPLDTTRLRRRGPPGALLIRWRRPIQQQRDRRARLAQHRVEEQAPVAGHVVLPG